MRQQLFTAPPTRSAPPTYIPQDVPVYRVKEEKGFFVDDTLHPAGTIIEYAETPNAGLEPMNELAITAMRSYLAELDRLGLEWSTKNGKAYVPQLKAFENSLMERNQGRGGRARVLNSRNEVPLMGGSVRQEPKASVIVPQESTGGEIKTAGSLLTGEEPKPLPVQRHPVVSEDAANSAEGRKAVNGAVGDKL